MINWWLTNKQKRRQTRVTWLTKKKGDKQLDMCKLMTDKQTKNDGHLVRWLLLYILYIIMRGRGVSNQKIHNKKATQKWSNSQNLPQHSPDIHVNVFLLFPRVARVVWVRFACFAMFWFIGILETKRTSADGSCMAWSGLQGNSWCKLARSDEASISKLSVWRKGAKW